jgi:hypothetical protein
MKHLFLIPMLAASLLACQQNLPITVPTRVLGAVALPFGDSPNLRVAVPDAEIAFVPLGAASVLDDAVFNTRFIRRGFRITNNSNPPIAWSNLIFHAYNTPANTQGTALKSISNFAGQPVLSAQQGIPKHGMTGVSSIVVDPSAADLQLFSEATVNAAQIDAASILGANDYLLSYGFLVQQRNGDTDSDGNPRTIAAGETGTITVSYQLPKDSSNAYSFVATFSLRTTSDVDVVQTQEEQLAGTTAGQTETSLSNVRKVTVPGGQACGGTLLPGVDLVFINQLRLAGKVGGTGTDTAVYAFNTPRVATVAFLEFLGDPIALRSTIINADDGDGICFLQNSNFSTAGLFSSVGVLRIAKNITIYGGKDVSVLGGNTTRIFEIATGFNVGMYGFTISNGTSSASATSFGGGAISNAGTLTLGGMKFNNNRFAGLDFATSPFTPAKGGAIYNTGVLNIGYSEFKLNTVQAGRGASGTNAILGSGVPGTNGELGGAASGGAIFSTGTLQINSSQVSGNSAIGGRGGIGGLGTTVIDPSDGPPFFGFLCNEPSGFGGLGGNAIGGGIFSSAAFTNNANVTTNTVTAGIGGFAGGPNPCASPDTSNAAAGTASNPNVAP